MWGYAERPAPLTPGLARVGVLYYRAHQASGNTAFAHALADAIDATGTAIGVPVFTGSLRSAPDDLYEALGSLDALIVTVLAAGGSVPAEASAGGDDEAWDVERMAALDIPVFQGLCLTSSRAEWLASDDGVTPLDSASQIAIPEFDGRIITAPFSFKELDEQGLPRYVADPERTERVARIAVNHVLLRRTPNAEKRLALVLSAYPTKHARIGNAVGLDTPVSLIRLLEALREAGVEQTVAWIGGSQLIRACAGRTGLATLNIGRQLAPELFEYNRLGAWNGHIPVTAINSAILAFAAVVLGVDQVVFSNERSASYGSLIEGTGEVNHQWSKGWAFERAFAGHLQRCVAADLRYYSLLRPLSELAVARQFTTKHPRASSTFWSRSIFGCAPRRCTPTWCCRRRPGTRRTTSTPRTCIPSSIH